MAVRTLKVAFLVVSPLLIFATVAASETYFAGLGGAAIPLDQDVNVRSSLGGFRIPDVKLKDVEIEKSAVFGIKLGHFFEDTEGRGDPGLEVELYYFKHDIEEQTVSISGDFLGAPISGTFGIGEAELSVFAVELNGLYRLNLARSNGFPNGRFQPYGGIGVGLFVATLESSLPLFDWDDEDTDYREGVQGIVGTKFFLTKNVSVFAEYKFILTADFEFELEESGIVSGRPMTGKADVESELIEHLVYAGLAYHF